MAGIPNKNCQLIGKDKKKRNWDQLIFRRDLLQINILHQRWMQKNQYILLYSAQVFEDMYVQKYELKTYN
jgi:hypothetical protein